MAGLTGLRRAQVGHTLTYEERRMNLTVDVVVTNTPVEVPAALGAMGQESSRALAFLSIISAAG